MAPGFLTCSTSKGWIGRQPRTLVSPEFPGTAVAWEGELFEVLRAEAHDRRRYPVRPQQLGIPPRGAGRSDATTTKTSRHDKRNRHDVGAPSGRNAGASFWRRWPATFRPAFRAAWKASSAPPARFLTIASALPLLLFGVLGLVAFLLAALGGGDAVFAGWPILPLPVAAFLFLESATRLAVAFVNGEPMGSVAGGALYAGWLGTCKLLARRSRRYASPPNPGAPAPVKEDR